MSTSQTPSSTSSGGRRESDGIHDKPSWSEARACSPWLGLELENVRPELVVRLGRRRLSFSSGAARASARFADGSSSSRTASPQLVSLRPSAILRAGGELKARRAELLEDLELARDLLAEAGGGSGPARKH